jgi:hypothetical protein
MSERIQLDPLINRRVIFKLHGQESAMDATILSYDANGYWIQGGTLADYLTNASLSNLESDIRYLEISKIEWIKAYPLNSK